MTAAIVIGFPVPLLAIHLLWINLVTDGLPALCLATDPIDSDVMKQPPRARQERITDGGFLRTMFLTGALTAGLSFAVYLYALKFGTPELARTYAFTALVFAELLRSFGARSETRPLWRMNHFTNLNLLAVVGVSFTIQLWSHHNTWLASFLKTSLIPLGDCLLLLAVSAIPLLVLEARKASLRHRLNQAAA
jgi:Ca2+-transporting ATPase